jgi:hypothetical protein
MICLRTGIKFCRRSLCKKPGTFSIPAGLDVLVTLTAFKYLDQKDVLNIKIQTTKTGKEDL